MDNYKGSSVNFTKDDYARIRENFRKWWAGDLGRPIVPFQVSGFEAKRGATKNPNLWFGNSWDMSVSPEQFVDAHDWWLSQVRWYGESFPLFAPTAFGPGTAAAFLGCTPMSTPQTVWFDPPRLDIPIEELHFEVDYNNKYLRRVVNLYEAAMEKWHGAVVIGMVDMGGVLDILSSFRGAENLLCDLYDAPDEVIRCVNEIQAAWFKYYDLFNSIMASEAEGYSDWYNFYCEEPGYILQSDFSYMISPDMFNRFTAPELATSSARIKNAVYHVDGIGELPHLDTLLAIEGIKGYQWVPGDGEPLLRNWDEVLSRILASGKKLISHAKKADGHPIDLAKDPGQLLFNETNFHKNDMEKAKAFGEIYGIEVR